MKSVVEKAVAELFTLQQEYGGTEKPVNTITPLVSVMIATYMQEAYIKQCLEGVLMQQTDFPFEIIIGEDGSTDDTAKICMDYAERFPDKIRLFIRDRNLSQFKNPDGTVTRFNGLWNRMSARGTYIAFCDGDDYWTDPLKLQKQVRYMQSHPDCGMCYTRARNYHQNTDSYGDTIGGPGENLHDFMPDNPAPTLTVLIRRDIYENYELQIRPITKKWRMGDYPMWLYFAINSKIHFIDDITATYRILESSLSHFRCYADKLRFVLSTLEVQCYFNDIYGLNYWNYHVRLRLFALRLAVYQNDETAIKKWRKEVLHSAFDRRSSLKNRFKSLTSAIMPRTMSRRSNAKRKAKYERHP